MQDPQRLQKLSDMECRWKELNTQIVELQEEHDRETRREEQLRQEAVLGEKILLQKQLEAELQTLTLADTLATLQDELFTLQRNHAYAEALNIATRIQQLTPDDATISDTIRSLREKVELHTQATALQSQLLSHIGELGLPLYKKIANALQHLHDANILAMLLTYTSQYLQGNLPSQHYRELCSELLDKPQPTDISIDYAALSRKILDGDTVLFIGADIPCLYGAECPKDADIAKNLAQAVHYDDFAGDLFSIAEFYQLRMEYGQKPLIQYLKDFLPQKNGTFPFYQALANNKRNLILISSSYDRLLETAFVKAGKPFVNLSSIVHSSKPAYKIGDVVVTFSDNPKQEFIYPQEKVSELDLLKNYSIIYKIRGSCDIETGEGTVLPHALALSESNYFTLAEYARRIIPDPLVSLLLERDILFIGFTPNSWGDRLLARILLNKHRDSGKARYILEKPSDPLLEVFWRKQEVGHYNIDFKTLDHYLQEASA